MNFKELIFLVFVCLPQLLFAGSQTELNKAAFSAIKSGDVEAVRELIDQGLDPNFRLGGSNNVLLQAVFYEQPTILSELISAGGNVDHKLDRGMYFVNFVVSRDNFELLKLVLKKRMNLNKSMYFGQFTIFTNMLRDVDEKTLAYIIENSEVDVNYIPENGYSALYLLYERGECGQECIKLLLKNCANPMLEIKSGEVSFREYVSKKEDYEVLNIIDDIAC